MHSRLAIPLFVGADWLSQLLGYAIEHRVCVRTSCTTCGAMPFRTALWEAAERADAKSPVDAVARQLSVLPTAHAESLRMVLHEMFRRVGRVELDRLSISFADSPAGLEYERMKAHAEGDALRRQQHADANDPEKVEAARARKKAERQDRHAKRLAAKAVRDAERRGDA